MSKKLSSVATDKFISALRDERFAELFWGSIWVFLTTLITLIIVYPNYGLNVFLSMIKWHHYIIPVFIFVGVGVYFLINFLSSYIDSEYDVAELLTAHIMNNGTAKFNDLKKF